MNHISSLLIWVCPPPVRQMSSMKNLSIFALFLLLASWGSANANGLSQNKDAIYPKIPVSVPVPAPAPTPVYKSPPVKPPTSPVLTPPPVKAPYTPVPSSPPMVKPPSTPPPAPVKAPYTPSPTPVKPPSSSPPAKAPYIPSPPVKPPSPAAPKPPPLPAKECYPQCGRRCAVNSRKNLCIRACVTCCYRCKCVPPGTYGNREVCGKCYTDMTTHDNKIKCP